MSVRDERRRNNKAARRNRNEGGKEKKLGATGGSSSWRWSRRIQDDLWPDECRCRREGVCGRPLRRGRTTWKQDAV